MKTQLAALALSLVSASVFAGTANISGNYSGTYNLEVRTTSNALMAKSSQAYNWKWDFDKKTVSINNGFIRSKFAPFPVGYAVHKPVSFKDNGNGTYTLDYTFQAYNPLYGFPKAKTKTVFEITDTGFGLEFKTLDSDGNGVIGEPIYGLFPWDIELNWTGSAN
ncbi:hypothetical protein CW749_14160 [Vibrio sp. vnigr-6D03]|uniref:hypothetical protein n=1 Tax=Vibrio TaxID=662 RepID=UPI000C33F92E|nr:MULTISPECIES: hypothetical protein [Vibrio]MDP2573978.1 hypothetical protein [Vibrio penaeicida]PKF79108.1 hypothetical protein CW749_14160 [Vibrio sp. vnigr-6D03]